MNPLYILQAEYEGISKSQMEPIRSFKGQTEITFNLSQITQSLRLITKIIVDFNDGTPISVNETTFEDTAINRTPIIHTFHPNEKYDSIVYYPTIYIVYDNFTVLTFQMPVKIFKPSFYSEFENLSISNCQFIDDSNNSMFITLDTAKGDILNLKIK